jgi:hypothetical protein
MLPNIVNYPDLGLVVKWLGSSVKAFKRPPYLHFHSVAGFGEALPQRISSKSDNEPAHRHAEHSYPFFGVCVEKGGKFGEQVFPGRGGQDVRCVKKSGSLKGQ